MMLINILSVLAGCVRIAAGFMLVPILMVPDKDAGRGSDKNSYNSENKNTKKSSNKNSAGITAKTIITGIVSSIIAGAAIGTGIIAFNGNEVARIAAEIIVIMVLSTVLLRIEYRKCLFVAFFYEIAAGLCQFVIGAGLAIALLDEKYMDAKVYAGQIAVWMVCIASIALVAWIYQKNSEQKRNNRAFVIVAIVLFFAIVTIGSQDRLAIPQDTVYMWTIFTACLFGAFLVFSVSKQYEVEKKLAQVNAEQAELLEKEYTELNNAYATNAKLFHDFHNHIGMIRKLVTGGKYDETVAYLDELQAPVRELTDSRWTGDDTIDYLINGKIANANEHNIDMQVQVEYPRHANIKSVDMCAIIGNLIDNALEAAKQVGNKDERFIRLTIRRINQMLVIKVENSFEAELRSENGQLMTTKKEGGIHGWGIKSVRAAVEKYDGTVQMTQENKVFKAVATLSFQGTE